MAISNNKGLTTTAALRLEKAWALRDNDPAASQRLLESLDTDRLDPSLVAPRLTVQAFLLAREGKISEALALALEAESISPREAVTTWRARNSLVLGGLYSGAPNSTVIGYLDQAIREATELNDRDLLFGSYHDLALQFLHAHDWPMAISTFDKAEEFVDDNVDRQSFLALNRAELFLRQERPEAALEQLANLPNRHTDGAEVTSLAFFISELKAVAAAWVGRLDEAEGAIEQTNELSRLLGRPSECVHLAQARLLLHRGEHEAALKVLDDFEENEPENLADGAGMLSQVRIDIALDRADYKQAYLELKRASDHEQRVRAGTQASLNELQLGQESDRLRKQAESLQATNAELAASMKELRELHHQVLEVSVRDSLTRLFNRRQLFVEAGLLMRLARRHDRPFSLAMVDVDHFKSVNDQHFHSTGDAVLCELADILTSQARESDLVGRYGGDEFVVLLPEVDLEGAQVLCERIRRAVEVNDWEQLKPGLKVTVTIGIAQSAARESAEDLLHRADQRLFVAKKLGRNQVAS